MSDDPKRWLDDAGEAPPGARELLAQAQRTKGPDKRALALSAAALLELGAQPSSAAAAVLAKLAAAPAALASLPLAGKLALAVTTVALVAVAGVQVAQRPETAPAEKTMPAAKTAVARSTAVPAHAGPQAAPQEALEPAAAPARASEPVETPAAEPVVASTTPRRRVRLRGRASAPLRQAPPAALAGPAELAAEPADELALEVRWLDQARALLAGDPAAALARADAHAQRFAAGALAAERELIAVDALQRLGRVPDARQRADALLARNPGSLYRGRLQRVLAASGKR